MKKYVRHIASALICFLCVLVLNFALPRLLPGDPVAYLTGFEEETMSPETYEYYYNALHLGESGISQFGHYLKSIFDGTLGYSYKKEATVSSLIAEKAGYSLQIMLPAVFISLLLSLLWGLHSGYKKGTVFDRISTSSVIVFNAVPAFMIAIVLAIVLSIKAGWFPYSGLSDSTVTQGTVAYFLDRIHHLVLPVAAVVLASFPSRYLLMRNTAADFADDKSVLYAKQRGLSDGKIKYGYLFKNIAQPFITMAGATVGGCIGGSIVVESVFSINGIGGLLDSAVTTLDYPLMQGILFVTTFAVVVSIVVSDVLCILIDPKVRKGGVA